MPEEQLTIGELADRVGVATSTLRYWEEIGLLPVPARVSGQRRYPLSVERRVAEILTLRDVGYTLRELKAFIAGDGWRDLTRRKIAELDARIARAQAARTALAQAVDCPHEDIRECPSYNRALSARLAGAGSGSELPAGSATGADRSSAGTRHPSRPAAADGR